MKRETIINTYKKYNEMLERVNRLYSKVPFKAIGKPDVQSAEWGMYMQYATELEDWLKEEIDD